MVIAIGIVGGVLAFVPIIIGSIVGMVAGVLAFLGIIAAFIWFLPSSV